MEKWKLPMLILLAGLVLMCLDRKGCCFVKQCHGNLRHGIGYVMISINKSKKKGLSHNSDGPFLYLNACTAVK